MGPRGLLSWNVLLFLSLAFERSCGTGCPTIFGRLGSSVLLPPVSDGISKSMNKSIYILITKAESPENRSSKKIVSLKLPEGGPSSHLENGYRFYPENLSLEILESKKEHEGWYTMTLEEIHSVQRFCLQLKLYEQVSAPEITVLNRTLENGNCSVVLTCTLEKGDHVVYSWSTEAGTHPLSAANASHPLYLTLGPQHADDKYICSVSNPISNRSQTFTPWSSCSSSSPVPRQWGLHVGLLLGGIIGVILIGQVVILLFRRRGHTDHYKPTVEATNLTIYAQVQKSGSVQKKPDPLPAQDPCTTIYVAAAEPAPEPAQKPSSITVYASVTLPES